MRSWEREEVDLEMKQKNGSTWRPERYFDTLKDNLCNIGCKKLHKVTRKKNGLNLSSASFTLTHLNNI